MIYAILFFQFFKIGLFAIGGGLVTVPFLFDLAEHYPWFTAAAGVFGGTIATIGLTFPSVVIIILIAKLLKTFKDNPNVRSILTGIRPAVIALICLAGWEILKISVRNWQDGIIFVLFFAAIHYYKRSPILYIIIAAIIGVALKL